MEEKKSCIIRLESEKNNIRKKRDSVLLDYATLHPKSPILLWILYKAMHDYGYNNYYQESFRKIEQYAPSAVKKSLSNLLNNQKVKTPGSDFALLDKKDNDILRKYVQESKYTLIDFWFSECHPCLLQFNLLKDVYKRYSNKGFDIVAISVDNSDNLKEYYQVLYKENYPWKQILDTGGIKATSLSISKFPTNFLIDQNGKIIYVDVDPFVLDNFLERNLQDINEDKISN